MRDKQYMTVQGYVLVRTHEHWYTKEVGNFPFRKDKMSPQTCVLYLTEDAAERAKGQIYRGDEYTIMSVNLSQPLDYLKAS